MIINKKIQLITLVAFLLILSSMLSAQQLKRHEVIVAYIYNFAQNIQWENEHEITEIQFRFIGKDQRIIDELNRLAKSETLRNKTIKVSFSESLTDLENIHVLFIAAAKKDLLKSVFNKIEGKNILLISDGQEDKRFIMINFVDMPEQKLHFEINRSNIINQNLKIRPEMVFLGGTEVDVAKLYKESQDRIRGREEKIKNLEQNLTDLSRQTEKSRVDIARHKRIIEKQKEEIENRNEILTKQQENIDRQNKEIRAQVGTLEEKGATIAAQKTTLYLLVSIISLVLFLIIFVYLAYKDKRKRALELSQVNLRLKELDRMKSAFIANMSHELRTPLNSIIGFTGIILKGMTGDINEEQKKQLNMVYGSAKHLLGLINDILDLSKIEAGKMEIFPEDFEINELLNMVEKLVSSMSEEKGLKLITKIPEKSFYIHSDKNKVKQVLINLLSNAVKFTDKKGEITLNVERLPGEASAQAGETLHERDYIEISIEDTGRGIKEEDMKIIFDEFRQASDIDGNKPEGTGLGLPISRKMVEILGGKIRVESEYGKGSKFIFSLPIKFSSKIEKESLPSKRKDISKKLVLTIDDKKESQEMLRIYLESEGYEVIPAYTGVEAIKLAKELEPFAITLDIIMPGKDGWDILQELKNTDKTKDIPVIIASIMDSKTLGLSLGVVDCLVKPIEKDDLIKSLRHIEEQENIKIKNILVIDDNFKDVEYISAILLSKEANYHQVIKAYSGEEGLKLTKKEKIDLILLDLMMPEMDGFTVIRELKKNEKTKNIPMIIITAKDLSKDERIFLRENIEKTIIKGEFTRKELLEEIKKALKKIEMKEKLE
jgi:signal transduction histidine kinase/CheY-like chemotaxis protein